MLYRSPKQVVNSGGGDGDMPAKMQGFVLHTLLFNDIINFAGCLDDSKMIAQNLRSALG